MAQDDLVGAGRPRACEILFSTPALTNLAYKPKVASRPSDPISPQYRNTNNDMSDADVDALVRFIADLPQPLQIVPQDRFAAQLVERGKEKFSAIGCAACHVPQVGKIEGIFSDLLLHDMGEDFSDPVEPNPWCISSSASSQATPARARCS